MSRMATTPRPPLPHLAPGPNIVLVEDDASLLSALAFALEAEGFQIRAFASAGDLLKTPFSADCLQDGDGLSLIAGLRQRGVSAPAILITTNPDERCLRRAADANVRIVEKPLITGELRRTIEEAISRSSQAS